jgi:hypothetical protein
MSPPLRFVAAEVSRHALAAALLLCALAFAQGNPHPGGRHRRPPSPEALAACETKAFGDACAYTREGTASTGTCRAPEGKPLACRPAKPPRDATGQRADTTSPSTR